VFGGGVGGGFERGYFWWGGGGGRERRHGVGRGRGEKTGMVVVVLDWRFEGGRGSGEYVV